MGIKQHRSFFYLQIPFQDGRTWIQAILLLLKSSQFDVDVQFFISYEVSIFFIKIMDNTLRRSEIPSRQIKELYYFTFIFFGYFMLDLIMKFRHQKIPQIQHNLCLQSRELRLNFLLRQKAKKREQEQALQANVKMFKHPFSQQKKQKILNYQIQLIQNCTDSLFNSSSCQHSRYLQWNLHQTLHHLLPTQQYHLRWMGNDQNAHIYTYFYIIIISCSKHPDSMLQLKSVLYKLAQKYLSQYEQKLLIQFLCLIEYSQEKYLFFRKYAKIEHILLKIFKEIEHRTPSDYFKSPRNSVEEENNFSKLTTGITSPCRSLEKDIFYQQGEVKSGETVLNLKNSTQKIKVSFNILMDVYGVHFPFVKVEQILENALKVMVRFQRLKSDVYYVCVERECFFVIELLTQSPSRSSVSSRSCSILEQERSYIQKMLLEQKKKSEIQNSVQNSQKRSDRTQFTPKFISNKKKLSLSEKQLYDDKVHHKNIQVQVLDVRQFTQQSSESTLIYKKKINNLGDINGTIKSIDLEKQTNYEDFRQVPHVDYFGRNEKKIKTEQTLSGNFINKQNENHQRQVNNKVKSHYNRPAFPPKMTYLAFNKQSNQGRRFNPDRHDAIASKNIREDPKYSEKHKENENNSRTVRTKDTFSRETILSANNLKRMSKKIIENKINERPPSKPFHSHSPRNRLIDHRPPSYHPFASPLKPKIPLLYREKNNNRFILK